MAISEKVRELAESYSMLSVEERCSFAELVAPVDKSELSEEWIGEIRSRAQDIDSGQVELVSGDDFLRRLDAL